MTNAEKTLLRNAAHALEVFYLENVALNILLDRYCLPDWKTARDKIVNDPEVLPGIREMFERFRSEVEANLTSDATIRELEWVLPVKGKPI